MIDRNISAKRLFTCVTYLERISIDMPAKPLVFGKPSWLGKEQHNSQDINTVGREFR